MRLKRGATNIHYELVGNIGKPTLVMLHGFGNNSQNWYDLDYVKHLQPHLRLLMIDVRGFGKSDKPHDPAAYSLDNIAADILEIMDVENIRKAHCYGSSVGAIYAFYLATHNENRFSSFIFQGMSPYHIMNSKRILVKLLGEYKDIDIKAYVDALAKYFDCDFPSYIRDAMQLCDPHALYAVSIADWPDCSDRLAKITLPCLVIIGEHEGIIDNMQRVAASIPNGQLEILPGLDHAHAYWAGNKVSPLITRFIAEQIK